MAEERGRVSLLHPPQNARLYFKGRVYDQAPGRAPADEIGEFLKRPELLNEREADLAAVAYDPAQNSWRLLRDLGASPLYYAETADGFIWSFSYKGLIELLEKPEPDEAVLFDYLATHYRYIFRDSGRAFHKQARQVPAGCYVDFTGRGPSVRKWLKLEPDPDIYALGPDEATVRLMSLLRQSVHRRALAADRPAFTVSSGLDSSTVASLAATHLGDIDVFSVGYTGAGVGEYDETEGVRQLVAGKNWRWRHLLLDCPDLVEETAGLIKLTASPVVTVTWLAYYMMARQLDGFGEVFNGLGGDEALAGEFVHFFSFFADLKSEGREERLTREVEAWSRLHDHPVFKKNRAVLEDHWQRNFDFSTGEMLVDQKIYQANWRFFNDDWLAAHGRAVPPMPRPYPNFLSNRLYQEFTHETTPPTLWGLFMANQALGLTGVSPFMSAPLIRYCLALSGAVKYDRGLTKALLRRGLKGVLPESLRMNPVKTGFNAPIHQWFKEAKVAAPLREMLESGPLARLGWLKKGAAEQIFKEHESGQANHMMLLWPLLNTSLFLDS